MTLLEQYELATDVPFVRRTQQALVKSAIALLNNPSTPEGVAEFCGHVLRAPGPHAQNMAFGVATNPVITAESSDSDLEWTVNSMISAMAGVLAS